MGDMDGMPITDDQWWAYVGSESCSVRRCRLAGLYLFVSCASNRRENPPLIIDSQVADVRIWDTDWREASCGEILLDVQWTQCARRPRGSLGSLQEIPERDFDSYPVATSDVSTFADDCEEDAAVGL